jgi:CHAD domain-containing protein
MMPHDGSLGHSAAFRLDKWIDGIAPGDRIRQVAKRSLRARLDAVRRYLPLAAERAGEDVEHVHQLRVWTRRAQAALKLYADLLPRRRAAWIQQQLKRLRRAASTARDCDVLTRRLAGDHADDRAGRWLAKVRKERVKAQGPIVALSERLLRHGRFERRVEDLLRRVRPRRGEAVKCGLRFGDWARARLRPVVKRFFAASPPAASDEAALHQFRIRGKELRYVMELLAAAFPPDFREQLYPVVEAVQDRLGEINDLATAQGRLRERIEQAGRSPEATRLRRLFDDQQAQLERAHAEFLGWWTPRLAETLRTGFKSVLGKHGQPETGANPHSGPTTPEVALPVCATMSPHFDGR